MVASELEGIPEPGEVLEGKYRIERVLGIGGMGVVVEATHLHLGEKVAIKFLTGEAAQNEERIARFTREAWAAAKIKSDHVARVSDVSRSGDRVFLVMEYLEGGDLEGAQKGGPMPLARAVDYVLQASEALAEAHKLGIVHRDLKPGNLFVTHRADGSPWIKVLDFGISKFTGGGDSMTKTSSLMGSPLYMAPEQLTSAKHVDGRADIWALGVILFELITHTSPFDGDTLPQVCTNVLHKEPRPLHELLDQVPAEFDRVLRRALAKEPSARYQNLAELAEAIAPFGSPAAWASAEFIAKVLNLSGGQRLPLDSYSGAHARPSSVSDANLAAAAADTGRHGAVASAATVSQSDVLGGSEPVLPRAVPQVGAVTAAPVSTTLTGSRRSGVMVAAVIGGVLAVGAVGLVAIAVVTGGESPPAAETQPAAATEPPVPDEPGESDEPVDEPDLAAPSSAEPPAAASASAEPADSGTPEAAPTPSRPSQPRNPKKPKEWDFYKKR